MTVYAFIPADAFSNEPVLPEEPEEPLFEFGDIPEFFNIIKSDNIHLFESFVHDNVIDITETSSNGFNALHYAASFMKIDFIRFILDKYLLNAKDTISCGNYAGNTALHFTCLVSGKYPERALETVELLLNHGADFRAKDANGFSPLFAAVQGGNIEIVDLLLSKGESIKSTAADFKITLLNFSMHFCNRLMIKFLIDKGADIHAVDGVNREPIHAAAACGCIDGLKELIFIHNVSKNQASPSRSQGLFNNRYRKRCLFGAAPLHFAAKNDKLEAVKFLFLISSDYFQKDENDNIPYDYAYMRINRKIMELCENRRRFIFCFSFEPERDYENSVRQAEMTLSSDELKNFYSRLEGHIFFNNRSNC